MHNVTKQQVICIGELLIDFFCTDIDVNLIEGNHFTKRAGGAPANVAVAICRLGGEAAFVGKVGKDPFGDFLKLTLQKEGIDTSMLIQDEELPTTLAFVSLQEDGERDFVFNRGADGALTYEELDSEFLRRGSILHFGSATALLSDPLRKTYVQLLYDAQKDHSLISFDPNFRDDLWEGQMQKFIDQARQCIKHAHVVKVSEEELHIITNVKNRMEAVNKLHELGAHVIAVTLGNEGTLISNTSLLKTIPSVNISAVDSTGAGDAFVGALLYQLAQTDNPRRMLTNDKQLEKAIVFANKVGALTCTKIGAITALPTLQEVLGIERSETN